MMDVLAEQENIDLAIVVELAAQGQDAFGKALHQPFYIQPPHGTGNIQAQADLGAVVKQAHFLQRHARLLDQADQLRRFAFHALSG